MLAAPEPALAGVLVRPARAKVNLALHVVGRRADGYHLLDSLVAFTGADVADVVTVTFGPADGAPLLTVTGPFAAEVPPGAGNVVLAAAARAGGIAHVHLDKRLPVAAGIGGGSADAAAVLSAHAAHTGRPPDSLADTALLIGADVPVCLAGRPARMKGIGERLTPLALPPVAILLVNPGVAVSTASVFAALRERQNPPLPDPSPWPDAAALAAYLAGARNDLEPPALARAPVIGEALSAVRAQPGCLLARMSGSGATVFGLFANGPEAEAAAAALRAKTPWWVVATRLDP